MKKFTRIACFVVPGTIVCGITTLMYSHFFWLTMSLEKPGVNRPGIRLAYSPFLPSSLAVYEADASSDLPVAFKMDGHRGAGFSRRAIVQVNKGLGESFGSQKLNVFPFTSGINLNDFNGGPAETIMTDALSSLGIRVPAGGQFNRDSSLYPLQSDRQVTNYKQPINFRFQAIHNAIENVYNGVYPVDMASCKTCHDQQATTVRDTLKPGSRSRRITTADVSAVYDFLCLITQRKQKMRNFYINKPQ